MYFAHCKQVRNFLIATLNFRLSPEFLRASSEVLSALESVRLIIPLRPTFS
jgi:hypothetical protein